MIFAKIKKHLSISYQKINQSAEIKKIKSYNNSALNAIVDSFLMVKNSNFAGADLAAFKRQDSFRQKLMKDETVISLEILGIDEQISISDVCKRASSPNAWAQFLYSLTKNLNSRHFLEIGTNLGMSGSFILEALKTNKDFHFITMEGLPEFCNIAREQFSTITDEKSFEVIQGLYDDTFSNVLKKPIVFDTLFIDGNHQKEPTLEYFRELKKKATNPSVFIFDDIYWSDGMKETWKIIKNDKDVNYSIDLYKLGIIVIDKTDSNRNIPFNLHLSL